MRPSWLFGYTIKNKLDQSSIYTGKYLKMVFDYNIVVWFGKYDIILKTIFHYELRTLQAYFVF